MNEHDHADCAQEVHQRLDVAGLREALEQELATLNEHLGREYLYREKSFDVPDSLITRLEREAADVAGEESRLVSRVRALRYESLQKLLMPHFRTAQYLASRLNKVVKPIQCLGDDLRLDPVVYSDVVRSLVHVFRNAVDHGIESPEEREELGKEEAATLTCSISVARNQVQLCIDDDGRGLNPRELRSKALARGLIGEQEAQSMTDEQSGQLIFLDGMSSREEITAISGRGVGLSALRQAVSEVGGSLSVSFSQGEGTRFILQMPLSATHMAIDLAA